MVDCLYHRTLASRLLAAALTQCLPGSILLFLEEVWGGFYCDFSFRGPFSSEILIQLEEKIRQLVREKIEIRVMEMIPVSASEFLKKTGQTERAKQVLSQARYVRMIQIGSFVDWCERFCGKSTAESGILRLLEIKNLSKDRYRIFGITAESKENLKIRIQNWKQFSDFDHDQKGIHRHWWEMMDGQRIWLSKGLEQRRKWAGFWREQFASKALEVEAEPHLIPMIAKKKNSPILQVLYQNQDLPDVRGLLDSKKSLVMQINSWRDLQKYCISFLQTVQDSLNILGFTYRIRHFGKKRNGDECSRALQSLGWQVDRWEYSDEPRIEFLVEDSLLDEWTIASIQMQQKVNISLTVWIERNLALLLEMDREFDFK